MNRKLLLAFAMLLTVMLASTACNRDTDTGNQPAPPQQGAVTTPPPPVTPPAGGDVATGADGELYVIDGEVGLHPALAAALANFPAYTTNTNPILPRGAAGNILQVGSGSTAGAGFPGLWLSTHNADAADGNLIALFKPSLHSITAGNLITSNNGCLTFDFNRDLNRAEFNLVTDHFWHDGVPLTLDDLVFAYELIAHPDYTGTRFGAAHFIPNVVGVNEFRAGTVDYISGMVLSNNNRTLYIYYYDPLPPSIVFAGGIWITFVPRHWLTPVIEDPAYGHLRLEDHARARHESLGYGPFRVTQIVPGEAVLFESVDTWPLGAPLIDGIHVRFVPFDLIPAMMRAGEFDIAAYQAPDLAEFRLMQPTNYDLYGWPAGSTTILNFRLGYMGYDAEGSPHTMPRTDGHPITNLEVRRAMVYAWDRQTIASTVGQDLWVPAPSILHPFNASDFLDITREGFRFDLDYANAILDAAGFTERDAQGYRLDLNGQPFTIIYGQHSNPTHDQMVPLNIQNWGQIGLRVEMFGGDFADWGMFTSIVVGDGTYEGDNDPPWGPIDVFAMGWSLGMNPSPHGLWSPTATFNMARYNSPTFQSILDDINSDAAWEEDFLAAAYRRWEQAFHDELPAAPFTWNLDLVAVNNRVANLNRIRIDSGLNIPGNWGTGTFGSIFVGLTAPVPYSD